MEGLLDFILLFVVHQQTRRMLKEYLEIKLLFVKEKFQSSYHHSKNARRIVQRENLMENI